MAEAMDIDISIKAPGRPADELKGLASGVILGIPRENPENNTSLIQFGMTPEMLAECGAYLIRVARAMKGGGPPEPFGKNPAMKGRTESGLVLPGNKHFDLN